MYSLLSLSDHKNKLSMKKNILSCFALVCGAALLTSCAPSKEKVKEAFVHECKTAFPATISKELSDEYCSCSADKLMAKYSVAEMATLNQKVTQGDEKAKADMMKEIQPCLDELTKKATEQQPAAK
jgi:hypothetical protein